MTLTDIGSSISKYLSLTINVFFVSLIALIVFFAIMFGKGIYSFFNSSSSVDSSISSRALAIGDSENFVTSVASLDLLWSITKDDEISLSELLLSNAPSNTLNKIVDEDDDNLVGLCSHSVEITFGYESLSIFMDSLENESTFDEDKLPSPEILSINPIYSRAFPFRQTKKCMEKNLAGNRSLLRQEIENILTLDGVLGIHKSQGKLTAALIYDNLNGSCKGSTEDKGKNIKEENDSICWSQNLIDNWRMSTDNSEQTFRAAVMQKDINKIKEAGGLIGKRNAIQSGYAGIGAVRLTISTMFMMNSEWDHWFWSKKQGIYLQRDITNIVIGSELAPQDIREHFSIFEPPRLEIIMKPPRELFRDRQTSFIEKGGKDSAFIKSEAAQKLFKDHGSAAAYITSSINSSVSGVEKRMRPFAVEKAREVIKQRISSSMSNRETRLSVRFADKSGVDQFDMRDAVDFHNEANTE